MNCLYRRSWIGQWTRLSVQTTRIRRQGLCRVLRFHPFRPVPLCWCLYARLCVQDLVGPKPRDIRLGKLLLRATFLQITILQKFFIECTLSFYLRIDLGRNCLYRLCRSIACGCVISMIGVDHLWHTLLSCLKKNENKDGESTAFYPLLFEQPPLEKKMLVSSWAIEHLSVTPLLLGALLGMFNMVTCENSNGYFNVYLSRRSGFQ